MHIGNVSAGSLFKHKAHVFISYWQNLTFHLCTFKFDMICKCIKLFPAFYKLVCFSGGDVIHQSDGALAETPQPLCTLLSPAGGGACAD